MNRREFIKSSSAALAAGAVLGGAAAGADGVGQRLLRHRFGVNYVPSRNWYYCWNDWKPEDIARDFDRIAEVGADHLRIMLIWPWFQPNPREVSGAHLDRLDELTRQAAVRRLDVLATLYTGFLSGFRFTPPYYQQEPFYTSPKWMEAQELYLETIAGRMMLQPNFLGFDIGNEINCCWAAAPADGDAWMKRIFRRMRAVSPGKIHVNGVDHHPWFEKTTFSPEALVADQEIVALHCWPYWTGAGKYGKPLEKPYTQLPAAMAALARAYGKDPGKPVWLQEFGACKEEMPETDVPRWMELAVTGGIREGISWFTWWASHDVDPRFQFNPFEYGLGLMTVDNQIKDQGRMFKRLAEEWRGKRVRIPEGELPRVPGERTIEGAWEVMREWLGRN